MSCWFLWRSMPLWDSRSSHLGHGRGPEKQNYPHRNDSTHDWNQKIMSCCLVVMGWGRKLPVFLIAPVHKLRRVAILNLLRDVLLAIQFDKMELDSVVAVHGAQQESVGVVLPGGMRVGG